MNTITIQILTNPTTEEMGVCFPKPFKSESAAIRKAKKEGSSLIAFQPKNFMVDEDVWYVARP